jgi:hypothetical protein
MQQLLMTVGDEAPSIVYFRGKIPFGHACWHYMYSDIVYNHHQENHSIITKTLCSLTRYQTSMLCNHCRAIGREKAS